jgi:hypothetical protein
MKDRWFAISMFLAGCLFTGTGMAIRGDYLGGVHAERVQEVLEDRLEREVSYIREAIDELKEMVRDLE